MQYFNDDLIFADFLHYFYNTTCVCYLVQHLLEPFSCHHSMCTSVFLHHRIVMKSVDIL